MKKIFAITALLLSTVVACADNMEYIPFSALPHKAQEFIEKYYHPDDINFIEREDRIEYTVYMDNRTEIEFNAEGELTSIDCKRREVPSGIIPENIVKYIKDRYSSIIVEYKIDYTNHVIELSNDWELVFDSAGNLIEGEYF